MRLSHITTHYPTGVPIVTPGGMVWAFMMLVACATVWNDNITGAQVAGACLATNALSQYAIHRYHVRAQRRAATHA